MTLGCVAWHLAVADAPSHDALLNHSLSFTSLLESEELRCDLASLGYFSHWQTPSQVSQRFDTRFFVAALPPEQIPLESSYEVTHSLWLAPERAMPLTKSASAFQR